MKTVRVTTSVLADVYGGVFLALKICGLSNCSWWWFLLAFGIAILEMPKGDKYEEME